MKLLKSLLMVFFLIANSGVYADYFKSNGVDIFYTDSNGEGEPLLLIHGFSMDSSMWHETGIAEKLAHHFRVITLDCRGHGRSGKPESPEDYGPKVGLDIINLLDHLKIERAHVSGYSMGAYILGRLLVTHPDRMKTAVLVSGGFPGNDREELAFQEATAKDMEAHGEKVLAAVARGWKYDAVSDLEIADVNVSVQAIFGSKEKDDHFDRLKVRLELPKSALPIIIIPGADHDSADAAVLQPEFIKALKSVAK